MSETTGFPSGSEPAIDDEDESDEPRHPIAAAIDKVVHQARDIKLAARQFIGLALNVQKTQLEGVIANLAKAAANVESDDPVVSIVAQREVHEAILLLNRLHESNVPAVLETGLFLALFSAFDAFTGDLLRAIYQRRPALFASLNKTLTFADVLAAPSIEVIKAQVLDDDIEDLRRKSYGEQFASLEQRFDLTLTVFESWPAFVECSQRRNLFTHCDAVVSDQYLRVCRSVGMNDDKLPKLGTKIDLGWAYLSAACELVIEVGIKLGHTLWRKTLPDELKEADDHLAELLFETLSYRIWPRAAVIGEFALAQKKMSSDVHKKVITVNYAQALKRSDASDKARQIMTPLDWSGAANDFKLARAVLLDNVDEASELMKKIGQKGEMIKEDSYHTWPLFIEFRETDQFTTAYEQVYGHPYVVKLKKDASATSKRAVEEANKHREEADSSVLSLAMPATLEASILTDGDPASPTRESETELQVQPSTSDTKDSQA